MSGRDETMTDSAAHAEAIDWFVRGRTASADTAAAFQAWLAESAEHAAAYAEVEQAWAAAGEAAFEPEIVAMGSRFAGRRGGFGRRAIAAGLAAAVLGVGALGVYGLNAPKPLANQTFRTGVGQQATVTLPDGSVVTLNTDTVVHTRADGERRLVYLDKGQAFFKVAHDRAHPFVVAAAGRTVTALGTAFDVRVDHGALRVVLVEGKVRVEAPRPRPVADKPAETRTPLATEMAPGSQLIAPDDAEWRLTRTNVAEETSWLHGQIIFDDEPLGAVVDELNRYSNRKLVLADPGLQQVRISGIFRPGDLDGFARALRTSKMAQLGDETDGEVRIVALK
ncbi:MAG: FecR family protein [Ignavibacteriales bacterium]